MTERVPNGDAYEVDWVDLARVPALADAAAAGGAIGMGAAAALVPGVMGPDHRGMDALLLLLDDAELAQLRLTELPAAAADAGLDLLRYPIPDFAVPEDPLTFGELLDDVLGRVRAGERVVVACRGGFGRTGTVVGCLLRQADVGPEEAVALVRATRPGAIEREEQQAFVEAWNAL
jgi:hypothetical protein